MHLLTVINVVYKNSKILIVYKESGLPTAPLKNSTNDNLVSRVEAEYPQIMAVSGYQPWEGGLVHRLDNLTKGLVIFALSQSAFDFLNYQQKNDMLIKEYRAKSNGINTALPGFPPYTFNDVDDGPVSIISCFRAFGPKGASVRPLAIKNGEKVYRTDIVKESENSYICTITQGFRHQIRCHMAWAGHPLIGDERYGGKEGEFGLEAIGLSFVDPESKKNISIKI